MAGGAAGCGAPRALGSGISECIASPPLEMVTSAFHSGTTWIWDTGLRSLAKRRLNASCSSDVRPRSASGGDGSVCKGVRGVRTGRGRPHTTGSELKKPSRAPGAAGSGRRAAMVAYRSGFKQLQAREPEAHPPSSRAAAALRRSRCVISRILRLPSAPPMYSRSRCWQALADTASRSFLTSRASMTSRRAIVTSAGEAAQHAHEGPRDATGVLTPIYGWRGRPEPGAERPAPLPRP